MNITIEDIKEYWLKIVPEAKEEEVLRDLVKKSCGLDIDKLANNLINKEIFNNKYVNIINKEKNHKLEEIIVDLRSDIPFFFFYEPFINENFEKWFCMINDLNIIDNINTFFETCIVNLVEKLSSYASRALILEVNIARNNNKLKGNTEKEAFEYFHYVLLNDKDYLENFYLEYEELIKIISDKTEKYFKYTYEMLTNIKNNSNNISKVYNIQINKLKIKDIKTGLGDEHKSGETVALINFLDGFKLMYKPRNSEIDKVFQDLLEWVEKKSNENILPIRKLKIINTPTFGLLEFVDFNECKDIEELKEFYIKIGQLIAILHSLNAVDFHCENIIANGSNPILIDLETLFHPYVKINLNEFETKSKKLAKEVIENSVQSIGILPYFLMNESVSDAMLDISGLGAATNQKSPFKSYVIKNRNTANIKVVRENMEIEPEKNNPVLQGNIQKSENFINEIVNGFENCYIVLLKNKNEYIEWIKKNFTNCINRLIFRPTRDYTQLLNTSYHPDLLRNSEDRIIFFSRIFSNFDEKYYKIVTSEFSSLINSEVPCFKCKVNSRNLYDMNENEYCDYLDKTPLELVYNRINSFSNNDLSLQLQFIKIAFEGKNSDYHKDETSINFTEDNNLEIDIDNNKYIDLAIKIGNYILDNSIIDKTGDKNRTWVSAILTGRNEVGIGINSIGDDLYNGNSGVALFLTYLGYITGKYNYIEAASEAIETRRNFIDNVKEVYPYSIGAFNGLSGAIYVFDKLITYGKRESDKEYLEKYVKYLDEIVFMDKQYDLIGGSLGCIAVLLPIIKSNRYKNLNTIMKSIVNKCCINLINGKEKAGISGISWGNITKSTGFSHGNAGVIAYLSRVLQEEWLENKYEIENIIQEALKFERSLYIDKENNWFKDDKKDQISYGWCHGAPGILLSKCLAKEFRLNDEKWDEELMAALITTKIKSFGNNPSLCHGDLGNLEILYIASKILNDYKLEKSCKLNFNKIYETIIKERWKGKSFRGVDSYSLMVGLSGFGYSLLRFSELEKIPSLLWLE